MILHLSTNTLNLVVPWLKYIILFDEKTFKTELLCIKITNVK